MRDGRRLKHTSPEKAATILAELAASEGLTVQSRQKADWRLLAGLAALGTVGSLALIIGAASYPLSGLLIRPRLKRLSQLKSPHIKHLIQRTGVAVEDIVVRSFDSTRLHGWWMEFAKEAPTVVVLHGVNKNRTDVIRTALVLRRAGFNVLVFDGRGHGNSEGRYVTYGFYERRDVECVLDWLTTEKRINRDAIGLAGESMGAAIALQVAADNPWLQGVWADSPFASLRRVASEFAQRVTGLPVALLSPVLWTTIRVANYRGKFDVEMVDPYAIADKIQCPVYIVHGTADRLIDIVHSQNIYSALNVKKEIWTVEGGAHARAAREQKEEYARRIVEFFKDSLLTRLGDASA
jgi:dipeptidyl aminopeptidase/acylaminoacyl peptidase